jgi:hypothetical protein
VQCVRYVHVDRYSTFMIFSRSILLMKCAVDGFVEKIKTRFLASKAFVRNSCRLLDKVEKYCRAEQATEDIITRHVPFEC